MAGDLHFEDLGILSAAFETRFDEALLMWDRAGTLWDQVTKVVPDLKRQHVEPSKVVFSSQNRQELELTAELGRLGVVEHRPDKKLQRFSEIVTKFSDLASSVLELTQYSRVGLRLIFDKQFPTQEAAAESLMSTEIIKASSTVQFGISSPLVQPECSFRREDGKNGFSVRLKAETVKFEFTPAPGWSEFADTISQVKHRVLLDIDCYLQAPVPVERMRFMDWIAQTFHIIKRDGAALIGGS
jgi:hypothetical protein